MLSRVPAVGGEPTRGDPPEDFKSSGQFSQPTKGQGLKDNALAICPPSAHRQSSDDPCLTLVIDSWAELPEAVKAGIVAMVRASPTPLGASDNQENQGRLM